MGYRVIVLFSFRDYCVLYFWSIILGGVIYIEFSCVWRGVWGGVFFKLCDRGLLLCFFWVRVLFISLVV